MCTQARLISHIFAGARTCPQPVAQGPTAKLIGLAGQAFQENLHRGGLQEGPPRLASLASLARGYQACLKSAQGEATTRTPSSICPVSPGFHDWVFQEYGGTIYALRPATRDCSCGLDSRSR